MISNIIYPNSDSGLMIDQLNITIYYKYFLSNQNKENVILAITITGHESIW